MITKAQSKALRRRIRRFAQAHIDDSWKGGGDPADIPAIEAELHKAEIDLDNYIKRLEQK